MSIDIKNLVAPSEDQLSYNSYLKIHELLNIQKLQSKPEVHDEMLFIIIHQTYELWFKQLHHEISFLEKHLQEDAPIAIIKCLRRISRIQDVLNHQVDILETMTPNEFGYFRDKLNPASGFQSHQFRKLEFRLGLKNEHYLKFYEHDEIAKAELLKALEEVSLWDKVLHFLNNHGVSVPKSILQRDVKSAYVANKELAQELAKIYLKPNKNFETYEILELLLDFDQKLGLWRYRHVQMVERIIGLTMGTGGSFGVDYLSATLKKRAFPEIWQARQFVIQ